MYTCSTQQLCGTYFSHVNAALHLGCSPHSMFSYSESLSFLSDGLMPEKLMISEVIGCRDRSFKCFLLAVENR